FGTKNTSPYVKDAFHDFVVHGRAAACNPAGAGTKAAFHYVLNIPPGGQVVIPLRLMAEEGATEQPFGPGFDQTFQDRRREADGFYQTRLPATLSPDYQAVARQAYAGLLWTKQFYHYVVKDWLAGDPDQPIPPAGRKTGRNSD